MTSLMSRSGVLRQCGRMEVKMKRTNIIKLLSGFICAEILVSFFASCYSETVQGEQGIQGE